MAARFTKHVRTVYLLGSLAAMMLVGGAPDSFGGSLAQFLRSLFELWGRW